MSYVARKGCMLWAQRDLGNRCDKTIILARPSPTVQSPALSGPWRSYQWGLWLYYIWIPANQMGLMYFLQSLCLLLLTAGTAGLKATPGICSGTTTLPRFSSQNQVQNIRMHVIPSCVYTPLSTMALWLLWVSLNLLSRHKICYRRLSEVIYCNLWGVKLYHFSVRPYESVFLRLKRISWANSTGRQ